MERCISFNLKGYDPFINFIKAYAIICVLIGHSFPFLDYMGYGLWAGMQVPLFVLIQVFHNFKKDKISFDFSKLFWRILCPFVIVQACIYLCMFVISQKDAFALFYEMVIDGGFGPGAYFPWVYLQLAIVICCLFNVINKYGKVVNLIVALSVCEGFEILFSFIDLPDGIYRLLSVRYFLGWMWVKEGIIINWKSITLSFISLLSIIYFEYFSTNEEPWFFSTGWKFHRWPCYYYTAVLGVYLLNIIFQTIKNNEFIKKWIGYLATCSYEIFLVQMAVCSLLPQLSFIPSTMLRIGIRIILIFSISILGGIMVNKGYNRLLLLFNNGIQKNN